MKVIVGLGNPGEQYEGTRHNLGFMVVDKLGDKVLGKGASWKKEEKFKADIIKLDGLIIAKPFTYMNNSGLSVAKIVDYFKVSSEEVIIVHDDLDLPLGKIKVRMGGSGAGHHGVESVIKALKTDHFIRVRLGIGNLRSQSGERKIQHFDAESFVLETFLPKEKSTIKRMLKMGIEALDTLLEKGLEKAQNQFN